VFLNIRSINKENSNSLVSIYPAHENFTQQTVDKQEGLSFQPVIGFIAAG
jgi:hypothetical protein